MKNGTSSRWVMYVYVEARFYELFSLLLSLSLYMKWSFSSSQRSERQSDNYHNDTFRWPENGAWMEVANIICPWHVATFHSCYVYANRLAVSTVVRELSSGFGNDIFLIMLRPLFARVSFDADLALSWPEDLNGLHLHARETPFDAVVMQTSMNELDFAFLDSCT